ncbi:MAG: hypothetical protein AAB455_02185 [Patescibacteria group bacterium]
MPRSGSFAPKYTPEQEEWLKGIPPLSHKESGKEALAAAATDFNTRFNTNRTGRGLIQKQWELLGLKPAKKLAATKPQIRRLTAYTPEMDTLLTTLATNDDLGWAKRLRLFNTQFGTRLRKKALSEHWRKIKNNRQVPAKAESKGSTQTVVTNPAAKPARNDSNNFRLIVNGEVVWSGKTKPQVALDERKLLAV